MGIRGDLSQSKLIEKKKSFIILRDLWKERKNSYKKFLDSVSKDRDSTKCSPEDKVGLRCLLSPLKGQGPLSLGRHGNIDYLKVKKISIMLLRGPQNRDGDAYLHISYWTL